MKKERIGFCLLCCVALNGMAQEKYVIKGATGAAQEGKTVFLYQTADENNMMNLCLDSAQVKKGTFRMKGTVAKPCFAKLQVAGADCPLILEKGTITVDIDSVRMGGTSLNDALNQCYHLIVPAMKRVEALGKEIESAGSEPEAQIAKLKEVKERLHATTRDLKEVINLCIEENLDNMVPGSFMALGVMVNSPEKMDSLLAKASPECLENGYTQMAIKQLSEKKEKIRLSKSNTKKPVDKMEIGKPFLDGKVRDASGKETTLSAFLGKGKYVLIDFWASWCGPCKREMPHVKAAYEKYKEKGFEVLGVSVDKDEMKWKEAVEELGMVWPQMLDVDAATAYGVQTIPYTFLVAPDGTVIAKKLRGEALERKLSELLQ